MTGTYKCPNCGRKTINPASFCCKECEAEWVAFNRRYNLLTPDHKIPTVRVPLSER
jgi:uncharacterized OB-fold protein